MSFVRPLSPLTTVTRLHPLTDGLNNIVQGTTNSANTRTIFRSPKNSAITDITVGMPSFYNAQPEANHPIEYVVKASLEYPLGTTPKQFFEGTASSITVSPGRGIVYFDPHPTYIPADTEFAVKLYITWAAATSDFPLCTGMHALNGEWTDAGVNLSDATLNTTTQTHDYPSPTQLRGLGIGPIVFGRMKNPSAVLGILGDSICQGTGDIPDSVYGGVTYEKGIRNEIPVINVARQAETFANFLSRPDGRLHLLRDNITHLILAYGRNDVTTGSSAATIWANLQTTVNLFAAHGIKVYANTITPVTTSSDNWATKEGQTSASNDSVARAVNTLIRDNWLSIGLAGIFDIRRVVDPLDTGIWNVDHGFSGRYGYGVATIANNGIDRVELPVLSAGTAYGGEAYPASATAHECVVYAQPDDPIPGGAGGGRVTAIVNGSGVVTGYRVLDRGRYSLAPFVAPLGRWTSDGTHMTSRAYFAVISQTGICASRFLLD